MYIPSRNITIKQLWGEQKFIIDKICEVLFTSNYNQYCKNMARSVLNFIAKAKLITPKQAKLIMSLKPYRK